MKAAAVIAYRITDAPWPLARGSHRALVQVDQPAAAVLAHIVWRRADLKPETKDVIVIDATTQQVVENRVVANVQQESGDVIFQPVTVPGLYEIYYRPFDQSPHWGLGKNAGQYKPIEETADAAWLERFDTAQHQADLPRVSALEIQARTERDNALPMGLIATAAETDRLLDQHPHEMFLLFPTPRELPIRLTHHLPLHWICTGPSAAFSAAVFRNEFFTFQVGVFAARRHLESLRVEFHELRNARNGAVIPPSAMRCLNLGGVDRHGKKFEKDVGVGLRQVQALWLGIDVGDDIEPGEYLGKLSVAAANAPAQTIDVILTVNEQRLPDRGDKEPFRHSRLRWLDSTIGLDDEVVAPFTPLKVAGRSVSCLDRNVKFGAVGLPTSLQSRGHELLQKPVRFVATIDGKDYEFKRGKPRFVKQSNGRVRWESESRVACSIRAPEGDTGFQPVTGVVDLDSHRLKACVTLPKSLRRTDSVILTLTVSAEMEFDGFIGFELALRASEAVNVENLRLEIPLAREQATYMMGMGCRGGYRPKRWNWRWDPGRHQDSVWIGEIEAGLHCRFLDDTYVQPGKIVFGLQLMKLPRAWHNDGKGGCVISELDSKTVLLNASSGPRALPANEALRFDFNLLLTPFKRIDTAKHFKTRYYHSDRPLTDALAAGGTMVNIHHGTPFNPYINYPWAAENKLRSHIDEAHRQRLRLGVYYTVRELTTQVPELWALRSLNGEIFAGGNGGGHYWLQEHLSGDYTPAWYHPFEDGHVDAAIAQTSTSRWHNFYLEGLATLVRDLGIDGIYVDDTDLDRVGMQRARKIMERIRPGNLIDLHSNDMHWNMFGMASTLDVYMDLLPYIDRLWFGESFEYSRTPPDFWLMEISGIPFGVMSDIHFCELPANPWRGAVFGMTLRAPCAGERYDPCPIWKLWDEFGIAESEMIGYWTKNCPVRTDHKDVLATVYVRDGKTLIAVASWAEHAVEFKLKFDWKALGLNPRRVKFRVPAVKNFQQKGTYRAGDTLRLRPERGIMMIVEK